MTTIQVYPDHINVSGDVIGSIDSSSRNPTIAISDGTLLSIADEYPWVTVICEGSHLKGYPTIDHPDAVISFRDGITWVCVAEAYLRP